VGAFCVWFGLVDLVWLVWFGLVGLVEIRWEGEGGWVRGCGPSTNKQTHTHTHTPTLTAMTNHDARHTHADFVRGFSEWAVLSRERVWYDAEGIRELSKVCVWGGGVCI
jgi:hypothetical protein